MLHWHASQVPLGNTGSLPQMLSVLVVSISHEHEDKVNLSVDVHGGFHFALIKGRASDPIHACAAKGIGEQIISRNPLVVSLCEMSLRRYEIAIRTIYSAQRIVGAAQERVR